VNRWRAVLSGGFTTQAFPEPVFPTPEMMHLIDIHWQRKTPHPDKPATGRSTYAVRARYLKAAIAKASAKFRRQYGENLLITTANEKPDPAGIFSP
jgi:hypothetical protein